MEMEGVSYPLADMGMDLTITIARTARLKCT